MAKKSGVSLFLTQDRSDRGRTCTEVGPRQQLTAHPAYFLEIFFCDLTIRHMMDEPFNFLRYLLDDNEEEEEEDDTLVLIVLASQTLNNSRASFYVRGRLEWEDHVAQLEKEGPNAFHALYRMDKASFLKLCSLIHPFLQVDQAMSTIRTGKGPITTEITLHCLLRWLGGGSYLDIRLCAGISIATFYRVCYQCVEAILCCAELSYSFPSTAEEFEDAAKGFRECSSNGVIDGCVGCVDGLLLQIQTPASNETGNVKAYFSGHYQAYGINVQAACDAQCRFTFASLAAPGGANDIAAFRKTTLHSQVLNLPLGKYLIGDNAYVCSEHFLTPFSGDEKKDPQKDAYNFFLSQIRIRVEMTFGLFVSKWRIFKKPLNIKLKNVGRLFLCATRLHNFCIDNRESGHREKKNGTCESSTSKLIPFIPSDIRVASIPGNSMMRDVLVQEIASMVLARPVYNLERNG